MVKCFSSKIWRRMDIAERGRGCILHKWDANKISWTCEKLKLNFRQTCRPFFLRRAQVQIELGKDYYDSWRFHHLDAINVKCRRVHQLIDIPAERIIYSITCNAISFLWVKRGNTRRHTPTLAQSRLSKFRWARTRANWRICLVKSEHTRTPKRDVRIRTMSVAARKHIYRCIKFV